MQPYTIIVTDPEMGGHLFHILGPDAETAGESGLVLLADHLMDERAPGLSEAGFAAWAARSRLEAWPGIHESRPEMTPEFIRDPEVEPTKHRAPMPYASA